MSRGDYLAANVPIGGVRAGAGTFTAKGGGFMIDLFARMPNSWFRVGQVRDYLERCGEKVSRDHVLDALNQLQKMAFLEKHCYGQRGAIKLYRYRRALTEAQRDLAARGARRKRVGEAMAARDA